MADRFFPTADTPGHPPYLSSLTQRAEQAKVERAKQLIAAADMRIQVVQREVNYVLGLDREHVHIAEYGAALIIAALDSFDEHLARRADG